MFKCFRCKQEKPSNEFSDHSNWWCDSCIKGYFEEFLALTPPKKALWALYKEIRPEAFPEPEPKEPLVDVLSKSILVLLKEHSRLSATDIAMALRKEGGERNVRWALKILENDKKIVGAGEKPRIYRAL